MPINADAERIRATIRRRKKFLISFIWCVFLDDTDGGWLRKSFCVEAVKRGQRKLSILVSENASVSHRFFPEISVFSKSGWLQDDASKT
jgi:hypothetical protein